MRLILRNVASCWRSRSKGLIHKNSSPRRQYLHVPRRPQMDPKPPGLADDLDDFSGDASLSRVIFTYPTQLQIRGQSDRLPIAETWCGMKPTAAQPSGPFRPRES